MKLKTLIRVTVIFQMIFCLACFYYISMCYNQISSAQNAHREQTTISVKLVNERRGGNLDEISVGRCNLSWEVPQVHQEEKLCQEVSPYLVGRLNINATSARDEYNRSALLQVQPGGLYTPPCVPRERVAIIIPYRDRLRHLQILVNYLHAFLQRQQLQYAIYVVEMAYPTQFNRGMLANIGFLNAREMLNFTCYIIHDVDQLPADDRNMYHCSDNPRHLSVASSKYGYKLPYGHYNGGSIAFTPTQYLKINGFSNAYFGWGKEDDDLHKRILKAGYKLDRPQPDVGVYEEIPHRRDFSNPDNPMKDHLYMWAEKRFQRDGVNRVLYTRLALEFRSLYTWVFVNTSEVAVMKVLNVLRVAIPRDFLDDVHIQNHSHQQMYSIDPELRSAFARIKKSP